MKTAIVFVVAAVLGFAIAQKIRVSCLDIFGSTNCIAIVSN